MQIEGQLKPIEILLVEDSPVDRIITTEALGRSGLLNTLNVVEDGVEAMAYLHKQGKFETARRPDLVLLDLNLPRKDGREVLAELKADPRLMYIPVIILTTSKSDQDLLRAYGHHANGYITKPLGFAQLAEALRTLGGYWFKVVTLPADAAIDRLPSEEPSAPRVADRRSEHARVLIVTPEVEQASMRQRFIGDQRPGITLRWATNLQEAADLVQSDDPDLLFVDLDLPSSQGIETYRRARRVAAGAPVIVVTAMPDDAVGAEALREGADDYVDKEQLCPSLVARCTRYALQRRQHREQLRRAQKLETLGRLVAGVSHDFNNLLSVVRGSTELLLKHQVDEQSRSELLLSIQDASQRASIIASQLVTFSRQRPMSMHAVDLNQVIGSFTRLLRRMLGEAIHLELRLTSELPGVMGDAGMIDQVLLNLALNARDAMPEGGRLRLLTSAVAVGEEATTLHPDAYPGWFAKLAIGDTGAGIEPDILPHIFEPFYTTKSTRNGTGLGLAMVHSIIRQHKGWVSVNTERGVGTTFEVFLPVSAPEPIRPTLPPRTSPQP